MNREEEDLANRFMNGFALLWVGFQLGEYIITNFFTDPYIWLKTLVVAGLFVYAFFIMRLTLLKKDITRYIARIGEVSAVNIAAMLFIQDLLVINDWLQFLQLVIAFIGIYALLDLLFQRLVDYIYKRVKIPVGEEEPTPAPVARPEPTAPPRYERITRPAPRPVARPVARPRPAPRPVAIPRAPTPIRPPVTTPPVAAPVTPPIRPPVRPPATPAATTPPKKPVKKTE